MNVRSALFLSLLFAASAAAAYDGGEAGQGQHTATSAGARAAFYHPGDADHGTWAPGAVLRLHMTSVYSFEASADFAHYDSGGTRVRTTAVQATVLGYFAPDASLSPYLLIGGGWYPTHADGPYNPMRLFGPHVGLGLELLLGSNWSLDGSYRYLWTETVSWSKVTRILGTDFGTRGHMFTLGLTYRL
ncbi:MAG: outer membrane beta-barrel protein [Elusimicrobia bacterium]|nr:outer membrane beta-barrel protein [Elusimicrobiota bacterium]